MNPKSSSSITLTPKIFAGKSILAALNILAFSNLWVLNSKFQTLIFSTVFFKLAVLWALESSLLLFWVWCPPLEGAYCYSSFFVHTQKDNLLRLAVNSSLTKNISWIFVSTILSSTNSLNRKLACTIHNFMLVYPNPCTYSPAVKNMWPVLPFAMLIIFSCAFSR